MKRPTKQRAYQIGSELQQVIGEFMRREVEPKCDGALVTVAEVRVSDDYKVAEVYISLLGSDEQKETAIRAIGAAKSKMKREAAQKVRLRKLPEFRFVWDDTLERADRIEQLLNKIHSSSSPPNEDEGGDS
ncbi:30S ribosome-binding factor RbfA [bacterium]|nr:30S ribosome-binding factor RbfA [bacterium]